MVPNKEHAVLLCEFREETQKDEVMPRLSKMIAKGDLEKHKRDKDAELCSHVGRGEGCTRTYLQRAQDLSLESTE